MKLNLDGKTMLILVLTLLLLGGSAYHFWQIEKHNDQHLLDKNLQTALTDTLKSYQNKEKEWVHEKLTLQTDIKDLKDEKIILTKNQQELIRRIEQISKDNTVISAALIEMGLKLDGLINNKPVVENDSTIQFSTNTDSIKYEIAINNVKPSGTKLPSLEFRKFEMPNTQFIEFHWKDNKKEGYPVSFSVTNSNPYYKVYDINSYAIKELTRENVKPTFWMKLGNLSKSTGGKIVIFGAGVLVGGLVLK